VVRRVPIHISTSASRCLERSDYTSKPRCAVRAGHAPPAEELTESHAADNVADLDRYADAGVTFLGDGLLEVAKCELRVRIRSQQPLGQ